MTQEEFKEEARRMRPKLLQEARRYLDADDAEDVVQDVLLRLWLMVDQLRLPADALASVLTRNLCVDRLRRLPPTARMEAAQAEPTEAEPQADERIDRLLQAMGQLPPLQQTILRLRHLEGMEMQDLAQLIGSTEVALRKALSRARQALRKQYQQRYDE